VFTCEFGDGGLVKIDIAKKEVLGYLRFGSHTAPQDIRASPDGKLFYVADMHKDGVFLVDGDSFRSIGFCRDRGWSPRALSEPRRQKALRRQSGLAQQQRPPSQPRQRRRHRFRDP
jgi:hypothetical protein